MSGVHSSRDAKRGSGTSSDDARVARALNEALAGGDDGNLASLLTDYFGQDCGDTIPTNSDESDDSDEDDAKDLAVSADDDVDDEPMDTDDDDDFDFVVPNMAANVMGIKGAAAEAGMGEDGGDWTSQSNREELENIENFKKCECSQRCIEQFDANYILNLRAQMIDGSVTKAERKMFLMGRISAGLHRGERTQCSKRVTQKRRQRPRTVFMVDGMQVCRQAFKFLHNVGESQLRTITKTYLKHVVMPPTNRAGGRKCNTAAFTEADVHRVASFVTNYADQNGLVIPGRISGVKASDPRIRLLPCEDTKSSVWRKYKTELSQQNVRRKAAELPLYRIAKRSSFVSLWKRLCPFVITTRPRSDLCWQCQQNNSAVYLSANLIEKDKMERLQKQQEHLSHVAAERNLYRDMVSSAKSAVEEDDTRTMHYSFDFAQQIHYPSDPNQPGPVYFLCPRKCGLFGIVCDGTGQQVNYLIDECMSSGKGSNSVISYLHDYWENFGLGESIAQLHCDNCGGQNKNKYVMWYLAWRTMCGLHKELSVHFMVSGHTKFSPDRGFGLVKHLYRRKLVSSLTDISDMVKESSVTGCNQPRLVGFEDGTVNVPCYDWQTFLSPYFVPLAGIKKYHHIRFHCDHPGVAFVKVLPDDQETEIQLLCSPNNLPPPQLPDAIPPPGLSAARREYLFRHIREFCTAHTRDTVCPDPAQMTDSDNTGDDGIDK